MSRPRPELPLGPGGVPRDGRAVMPGSGELGNATAPRGAAPGYNFAALVFGVSLILCVVGGNLLVCLSVCSERALQTATNYFIVSLAVADLLLALLVLPLYVYSEVSQTLPPPAGGPEPRAPRRVPPGCFPAALSPAGYLGCHCCQPCKCGQTAPGSSSDSALRLEPQPHGQRTGLGPQSRWECGSEPPRSWGLSACCPLSD